MRKVITYVLAFMLLCLVMTGCGEDAKEEAYSIDSEPEEEQEFIVEEEVTLEGILLSAYPNNTEYYVGDSFDPKGIEITAEYSDGSSEKVADGFTYYPEVFNEEGGQAVTIDFHGTITTVAVSVSKKPEVIETGTFGENITWTITDDGTLTISGTEMPESDVCADMYYSSTEKLWYNYMDKVNRIVVSEGVTRLGIVTAYESNIEDIVLPESLTFIDYNAFRQLDVEQITIPKNVKTIGSYAFALSPALKSITFMSDDSIFIGNSAFKECMALETVEFLGKATIDESAFYSCSSLKKVVFNNGFDRIATDAFRLCEALESVEILNNDGNNSTIDSWAFRSCSSLKEIHIPEGVERINMYAFSYCYLKTIELPTSLKYLYESFTDSEEIVLIYNGSEKQWNSIEKADLIRYKKVNFKILEGKCGDNVTYRLADGVLDIDGFGDMWNYRYQLKKETPWEAVRDKITKINIHEGITRIGWYAFSHCDAVEEITIPDGVTSIGENAFLGCTGLENVVFPDSLKTIEEGAFYKCSSLKELNLSEGIESIGVDAFRECIELETALLPDSITKLGEASFEDCQKLINLKIPNGILSINNAFRGTGLETIVIPNGVVEIGENAFDSCSSLKNVTIPGSVAKLGNYCFAGCESLKEINIPESVTELGKSAFASCSSLESITLPAGIKEIPEQAFYGCHSLVDVKLPSGITIIGDYAFEKCFYLEEIVIPDSVTEIGMSAFDDCDIRKLKMPKNIEVIERYAFRSNKELESITIPKTIKEIEGSAFHYCGSPFKIIYEGSEADWSNVRMNDKWIELLTGEEYTLEYDIEFLS